MSINVAYYDITQIDYANDSLDDGVILQSGANIHIPLAPQFKKAKFIIAEARIEHRGNNQTLQIDQRAKIWLQWELEMLALKYDATAPAWDWWDIINKAFYGAATGAPALRPGTIWLGAKINRATPEYWTAHGCKIEEVVIKGDMVKDHMSIDLKGIGRGFRLDTNNYVQGTATRRANPTQTPIVPSNDVTIKVDGTDITTLVENFTLTMKRTYEKRGRSAVATGSSGQVGLDGKNFREFIPNQFDGTLDLVLDPYGTTSTQILNQLNDKALSTVEIQAQNSTNGKQIQFTASKIKTADQEHAEAKSPSTVSLKIDGNTFNVNTL